MDEKKIRTCPSRCKTLVLGDATYRSAYDFSVTQEDLEKAREELNERDEERDNCIQELRKRLEEDSKLLYSVDDHYLLCYLRFRKFDIDKTFETIRNAHRVRTQHPELFALPANLEQMLELDIVNWLPYTDADGCFIFWQRFDRWNTENMSVYEIMQLGCCMMDVATMNPCCQINGIKAIWDCRGFSTSLKPLAPLFNPKFSWLLCSLWQDCYPERINLILLVNSNRLVKLAFSTLSFFFKKKVRDRIKILGSDVEEIHQYIDPSLLPKDLGGTIEDKDCTITAHIMDNLPYLRHMRSLGTSSSDS